MSKQVDATEGPIKDVFFIDKMCAGTCRLKDPKTGEVIRGLGIKFGTAKTPEKNMDMTLSCRDTPILFIPEEGVCQLRAYANKTLAEIGHEQPCPES